MTTRDCATMCCKPLLWNCRLTRMHSIPLSVLCSVNNWLRQQWIALSVVWINSCKWQIQYYSVYMKIRDKCMRIYSSLSQMVSAFIIYLSTYALRLRVIVKKWYVSLKSACYYSLSTMSGKSTFVSWTTLSNLCRMLRMSRKTHY